MDRRNQTNDLATPRAASIATTSAFRSPLRAPTDGGVGVESKKDLAAWLTAGRTARGMTREHVARVTRIQLRTIERLEDARFDELPADVFVRGFIRNYALCVGLSVDEALTRYAACGFVAAPVASAQAQALIDTMASLAPVAARTASVVVVAPPPAPAPVEAAPPPTITRKTRPERDARGRFIRKSREQPAVDLEAVAMDDLEVEITIVETLADPEPAPPVLVIPPPAMPPVLSSSPTLTIDDDDPDAAEREREERAKHARDKDGGWRSFLPPALLDQDRGRQGGLTLAVIILLIVATLTLSYLMRRPSSTSEGVTRAGDRATLTA